MDKEGYSFENVVSFYKKSIICISCLYNPKGRYKAIDQIADLECDGDLVGTCPKCESKKFFYNYTREDAVLTYNLVSMKLWHPKKGIRLME